MWMSEERETERMVDNEIRISLCVCVWCVWKCVSMKSKCGGGVDREEKKREVHLEKQQQQ